MRSLRECKYSTLLAVLVTAALLESLSAGWSERTQIVLGLIVNLINVGVLLVVFDRRWERHLALFLLTFTFAANVYHEAFAHRLQIGAIAYHCVAAVFLGFAVAVILKHIFERKAIRTDDVIGALCGYVLAGAAWGNIYALVYIVWPSSYHIAEAIAPQLGDWHAQRFLFDYFSIMTLTTLGFGHIAPADSPVYSLIWTESVFGQFYIAVVVAQLVGLRLAQAIKPDR